MDTSITITELLGPLNDIERKYAPKELYARGDWTLLGPGLGRVAIVGSRKASSEGIERTRQLARLLAEQGVVVVSGLAEGIDTAAHRAAIDAGGHTIAVLGTAIDHVYPQTNAGLQQEIMRDHLCLSQFPLGSATQRQNFPIRNRTMALISHVTVIMEAQDDSGSLNQGWEALRLGRSLFIAKSIMENPAVTWPQKFVNYGAKELPDSALDELIDTLPPPVLHAVNAELPFPA
jgi:DNA processing protein